MDTLEQTSGATLVEISNLPTKKATGRKPAAKKAAPKKAPTKRGAKAKAAENAEPAEDVETAEDAEPADDVEPADDEDTETKTESKKAAPKKAAVKKAAVKKAAVKKAAPRLNKMVIFKELYKTNPSKFDKQLTKKVKEEIATENEEKWSSLSEDALLTAQCAAYYHYMKEKHDAVLEACKAEYAAAKSESADATDEAEPADEE